MTRAMGEERAEYPRKTITLTGTAPVRQSVIDVGPLATARPPAGTMVLVHGAGGHAEQWKHQIDHFSQRYRVIAPDIRGHGRSDAPTSIYSLEEFLWDFTQMLDALAVEEPFILMAHSFGGPIGLTFAATQPKRVARLVLIATAPEMHLSPTLELALKLPLPTRLLEQAVSALYPKLHAPLFVIQRVLAGTLFPWRGWSLLRAVRCPTLIIGGLHDVIVPVSSLNRMKAEIPNARLELVRYSGHLPHLERPEAVNRHIEGFLEGRRSWRGEDAVEPAEPSDGDERGGAPPA